MKSFIKKYTTQIIVVIVTFLFLELLFAFGLKMLPFKKINFLISDLYYQYVPFFNYMRDTILSGRSLLNSFSFTMGQSLIGIISYYCLSPLNLILLFSNINTITYFVKILFIIKIVLCALNMSIYLNDKTNRLTNIAFSLIYTFTLYNIKYLFNIMWLDVIFMLPLVILGLEKIIDGKSNKLYIISLSIMIFSNFYLSFSGCIFILIYFLYYSIIKKKLTLKLFWKFAYSTMIVVLLNCFMLLPTSLNMLDGKVLSTASTYHKFILYNPLDIIYNFTPGHTNGDFLNDLPYFYSSVFLLVSFILFMFNKDVDRRERFAALSVFAFIILTTLIEPLDLLFHCFRVPNCLYFRYIYILPFFMISVVSSHKIKTNKLALIPISIIIIWALSIEFSIKMILFGVLIIIYYLLIKRDLNRLIVLLLIGELFYNGIINIQVYKGAESYDQVIKYGELLKDYMPGKNEFYRLEINEPITFNDSFVLGYYGVSSFSPTITYSSEIFLKKYLLFADKQSLNYVYHDRFILDPYFLGVKYEISNSIVKENDYYLPLIVKIDNFDFFEPTNLLIENANNLYKMINGEYLFKEIEFEIDCIKNNKLISKECNITYPKKEGYNYYLEIHHKGTILNDKYIKNNSIIEVDQSFKLDYANVYVYSAKLYEFDKSSIKNQINDFEVFNDNYMRLSVEKGHYLMMVPYDESWQISINGKNVKKEKILDSLVGFEVEEGTLEIKFIPRGLKLGIIISSTTLLAIFIYYFKKKILNK